jgi:uracil-DNA glycosylase
VNCRPYFLKELDLLKNVKVLVPLGQIALTQTLKCLRLKGLEIPALAFGHGKTYTIPTGEKPRTPRLSKYLYGGQANSQLRTLITTYHPSQQNTQTGKLTRPMFHKIFKMVKKKIEDKG